MYRPYILPITSDNSLVFFHYRVRRAFVFLSCSVLVPYSLLLMLLFSMNDVVLRCSGLGLNMCLEYGSFQMRTYLLSTVLHALYFFFRPVVVVNMCRKETKCLI